MGRAMAFHMNGFGHCDDTPFAVEEPPRYSITKEFEGATVLVTGETAAITGHVGNGSACLQQQHLLLL
jgi:hypothetical protein